MKKYQTPKIEIEEIKTVDIMAASGYGENELPSVGGGNNGERSITGGAGLTAGGSTVSRIVGQGGASMYSVGDVFGNK